MSEETKNFQPKDLQALAGISYRQVQYWDRIGLLKANRVRIRNQARPRYRAYDETDIMLGMILQQLRTAGWSIQKLRTMALMLRAHLSLLDEWCGWLVVLPSSRVKIFPTESHTDQEDAVSWWKKLGLGAEVFGLEVLWKKMDDWRPKKSKSEVPSEQLPGQIVSWDEQEMAGE
jgi:DNA-binding transcriptional MerR regulator